MPYSIAIASGKGGTGKTTLAVCLYNILANRFEIKVKLVDCDVEEPNDKIFFQEATETVSKEVFKLVPFISTEACTYCRKCVEYCEFNAVVVIPTAEFAEINTDLCHSCGACLFACTDDALTEHSVPIGYINEYSLEQGIGLSEGRLKIGSTMQTMLIRELKKSSKQDDVFIICDAPPGTSCPVVETIADVDYTILVAEPTPFGLHDLSLMIELLKEVKIPFGVVINKAGMGDRKIYEYLEEKKVQILGEIPFSRSFAKAYSSGNLIHAIPEDIQSQFDIIAEIILEKVRP